MGGVDFAVGKRCEMFFSVVVLLGGTLANSHTASPKHFVVVWWGVRDWHVTSLLTSLRILSNPTKKTLRQQQLERQMGLTMASKDDGLRHSTS